MLTLNQQIEAGKHFENIFRLIKSSFVTNTSNIFEPHEIRHFFLMMPGVTFRILGNFFSQKPLNSGFHDCPRTCELEPPNGHIFIDSPSIPRRNSSWKIRRYFIDFERRIHVEIMTSIRRGFDFQNRSNIDEFSTWIFRCLSVVKST